jgi:AcrR family transcriptional regulator
VKDKRSRIIRAVEKLAEKKTFHEIQLDDVARLAQVGKGTIYLYFKDKKDLFVQVTLEGSEQLCEVIKSEADKPIEFKEKLVATCTNIDNFFHSRHALLKLMREYEQATSKNGKIVRPQQIESIFEVLHDILRQGVREGVVSSSIPLETVSVFLLGMMRTRAHNFSCRGAETPSIEVVVDLFMNGITV